MPEGEQISIRQVNEGHSHTKEDPKDLSEIAQKRKGSNCGVVALRVMIAEHEKAGKKWHVTSEHDFDPARDKPNPGFVGWLEGEYSKNPDLVARLTAEGKTPHDLAEEQVKATLNYGPERLIQSFNDIDELQTGIKVFKGVEASIMGPNGELGIETPEGTEVLNVSIHPAALPDQYKDVARDPKKYTEWVVKAMENNPKMNVICHIGWDCPDLDIRALDWARIAKTAREHNVAIEINMYDFLKDCVYGRGGILDLSAHPENDTSWRKEFPEKINKYFPAVFDPEIRAALAPEIAKGLKLSITADQHRLPPKTGEFLKKPTTDVTLKLTNEKGEPILDKEGKEQYYTLNQWTNPQENTFRFVRALKMVEKEFNQAAAEMGIKPKQIVNTLSVTDYAKFLQKEL